MKQKKSNDDISKLKISWYDKLLVKFFPVQFFNRQTKKMGIDDKLIDLSFELFQGKKIHIKPYRAGSRGFIINLDNKFTLWFNQEGDHFVFDGFEIGEYDDGDVTVFDNLNRK